MREPVSNATSPDITAWLAGWRSGGWKEERLAEAVYGELRSLARSYLRRERANHTLDPTGLSHEAYLRLAEQRQVRWRNRHHFFGIAAQQMRRVLIDHARRRGVVKRGGGARAVPLASVPEPAVGLPDERSTVLAEALARLARRHPEKARLVALRYFGGLSVREVCEALRISPATYHRHWTFAKAWVCRALGNEGDGDHPGA